MNTGHLLILGAILMSLGALPFLFSTGPLGDSQSKWPTVRERVSSTNLYIYTDSDCEFTVAFSYGVGGVSHSSKQSWFSCADEINAKYSRGSAATVYYNPADPQKAVIKPGAISPNWGFYVV